MVRRGISGWRWWVLVRLICRFVESDRIEVTIDYLLFLRESGLSAAVAQRRLSGLSFHFKLRNWSDSTKSFVIRQALKGWKKEYVRTEHRRPVSYSLLVRLLGATDSTCSSPFEATLFRACFCLAIFAALRVGELVPPSRARGGGLLSDDVVLANGLCACAFAGLRPIFSGEVSGFLSMVFRVWPALFGRLGTILPGVHFLVH